MKRIPGRHVHRASGAGAALESDIQSRLVRELAGIGCQVTVYSEPRRTHIEPGHPDIRVTHPAWGLRCYIETKTATGRLSPAQREWHERERAAGGTVLVCRSVEDAVRQVAALPRERGVP